MLSYTHSLIGAATISIDQSHSSQSTTSPHKLSTKPGSLQIEHTPTATPEEMSTNQSQSQDHKRFFKRSESILAGSSALESEGDTEIKKSNQKFSAPQGLSLSPLIWSTPLICLEEGIRVKIRFHDPSAKLTHLHSNLIEGTAA